MSETVELDPEGDLMIVLSAPEDVSEYPRHVSVANDALQEDCSEAENKASSPVPSHLSSSGITILFEVSSKHVSLASRRFRKMLSGEWMEATTVHPDGCRHVELKGFNSEATNVVLSIIHGKTRSVSRSVDFDLLVKIAILVDDLECHEEVEVFSDMWIEERRADLPLEWSQDVIPWILVSSVFRKPKIFQTATRTAILHSPDPMDSLGLPISRWVLDEMNQQREAAIEGLITALWEIVDQLRKSEIGCTFACQSILLGALVKQMDSFNLLEPRPAIPFSGVSFAQVALESGRFKSPEWYSKPLGNICEDEDEAYDGYYGYPKKQKKKKKSLCSEHTLHGCDLRRYTQPRADELHNSIAGLELKND